MNTGVVTKIAEQGITTVLVVSGPLMLVALVIGLIVSIFQATTQIQEQTLSFAPKIIGVMFALIYLGAWMITKVTDFTQNILSNLTNFIG